MAARFGVSRVSVREATKALGFLGVLHAAPRRGLTVGEFDAQRATEQLGFPLVLAEHPKSELLQTRIIIETGALPHVAAKMAENPAPLRSTGGLDRPQQARHDTLDERIATDLAFHRALLAASGLGPLVAFNDLLQVFFNRFRETFDRPNLEKKIRGHLHIIDSLRQGDVDSACEALRQHLDRYNALLVTARRQR